MKEANITGEDLLFKEPEYFSKLVLGNLMSQINSVKKKSRKMDPTEAFYNDLIHENDSNFRYIFFLIDRTFIIHINFTRNIGCFTSEIQRKLILAIVCKIILRRDSHYMACNIFDYM
ncbi:unnamed protein product [Rhizophagus irregularis]|nr:unnamed protein product [Rhizophagus irregularis]